MKAGPVRHFGNAGRGDPAGSECTTCRRIWLPRHRQQGALDGYAAEAAATIFGDRKQDILGGAAFLSAKQEFHSRCALNPHNRRGRY